MAIESPQKQLKRTFFILQHPRRHPRHFGSLLAALKADHEEPSYRTSADPEHAYLSTRKGGPLDLCRCSAQVSSELRAKKRESARTRAARCFSDL
jgi:hypothetical protein